MKLASESDHRRTSAYSFELMSFALTSHRDLVLPDILSYFGNEVGDFSGHITRGYGVGARKLNPFDCERFD